MACSLACLDCLNSTKSGVGGGMGGQGAETIHGARQRGGSAEELVQDNGGAHDAEAIPRFHTWSRVFVEWFGSARGGRLFGGLSAERPVGPSDSLADLGGNVACAPKGLSARSASVVSARPVGPGVGEKGRGCRMVGLGWRNGMVIPRSRLNSPSQRMRTSLNPPGEDLVGLASAPRAERPRR